MLTNLSYKSVLNTNIARHKISNYDFSNNHSISFTNNILNDNSNTEIIFISNYFDNTISKFFVRESFSQPNSMHSTVFVGVTA